jgi:signal transduction histidine kinase/GAF domain-containing protein
MGVLDESTIAGDASGDDGPRRESYEELARKVAQQGAVAELGRIALTGAGIRDLFDEAVRLTAEGLGTELAAILQPDELGQLTCRSSVGWTPAMTRPVPLTHQSQLGATFLAEQPTVVDDLAADERFPASRHLLEHGLTSAVSVVIRGDERPVGLLAAHSRQARTFTSDDVLFLRGIANVVAAACARYEAERARARSDRQLQFLAGASHALASSLDPEQTMAELARLVVPQLADWCVIHLLEDDRLVPVALANADPDKAAAGREVQERFPVDMDAPAGPATVIRSGRSMLVPEVTAEMVDGVARGPEHADALHRTGIRSALAVALVGRGAALGTITMVWAESGGRYDESDLLFAEELGRRAGIAIDNARTHQAELRARDRAERLQRLTSRLGSPVRPDEVYDILLHEGIDSSDAAAGLVALLDADGTHLEIVAARGYPQETMDRWHTFPVAGNYPLAEAVRTGEGVYLLTTEERDARYGDMQSPTRPDHSLVCLPVSGAEGVIGGIVLSFGEPRTFADDDRSFLAAVAAQAGQAIERTRLAATLAHEREQFATVLEQMPSGVIIAEAPSGKLLLGNEAVARIWGRGLPVDDQGARDYSRFHGYHVDGRRYVAEEWPLQRALRGETVVNEAIEIVRMDGERRISAASAAPVRDASGEIVAAVVVFSDMTAEYTARQEAERRADAARALAFVADGVCLVDTAGVVRLWNEAATRSTDLAADEVLGRPLADAVPGWATIAEEVPTMQAGADERVRPVTLPLELPGGERWISVAGVAFDEGVVYAFRDVTEERGLDVMKSDFIATVSHELRTPLAAIYGAAATLRRRPDLDPEEYDQFLNMIGEQAERLSRIVNEILVASRLESGELSVQLETVDAVELAHQVVALAAGASEGFEFELEIGEDVPPVRADADRLRQVLANLLENAQKYAGESTKAELHVSRVGRRVRYVVRDYGIGIPPGDRERIFEKFYRVDAAMTGGVSGTGLGLYIVRELVDRMDGRVRVEPAPGAGSSFVVELPAAD